MTYKYACNGCGKGKQLYFHRHSENENGEPVVILVPYERVKNLPSESVEIPTKCVSCGCRNLEVISQTQK